MDERNDHDVLICIEVKLKDLKTNFDNHLQHHFRYTIMAWTATIGLVVALILALVKG